MQKILTTLISVITCYSGLATAGNYWQKDIGTLMSPDTRPCTFFTLQGVTDVDGTGKPWFVIPQNAIGYKEMTAILLAAKMAGKQVVVDTTGQVLPECGHPEVFRVNIP